MEDLESILIIGLGPTGQEAAFAVVETAYDIGCKRLYLNTRTPNKAKIFSRTEVNSAIKQKRRRLARDGIDFELEAEAVDLDSIDELLHHPELAPKLTLIAAARDFGYGLKSKTRDNFLAEEIEKLTKRYGPYENWPADVKNSFDNAKQVYDLMYDYFTKGITDEKKIKAILKKEFRLFYSMPYNTFIIRDDLAPKFLGYKGMVGILTNPMDPMNYVFTSESGVFSFACSHYMSYRAPSAFEEHIGKMLEEDFDIILDDALEPFFGAEHGPDAQAFTSHLLPSKIYPFKKLQMAGKSIPDLSEALQEAGRKYVNDVIDFGLDINRESKPVIEDILLNLVLGGQLEISVVNKLRHLFKLEAIEQICSDKRGCEGVWSEHEADTGASIDWPFRRIDGEFRQVSYEPDLEEAKGYMGCYKKHHGIIDVLRQANVIRRRAKVRRFKKVAPPAATSDPKQKLTLDRLVELCEDFLGSERTYDNALLALSDYGYRRNLVDQFLNQFTLINRLTNHDYFPGIGTFISALINNITQEEEQPFYIDLTNLRNKNGSLIRIHGFGVWNKHAHYTIAGKLGNSTGMQMEGGLIEVIDNAIMQKWERLKKRAEKQSWERLLHEGDFTVLDNTGYEQSGGIIRINGVERNYGGAGQKGGTHKAVFMMDFGGEGKRGMVYKGKEVNCKAGDSVLSVEYAHDYFCKGIIGGFAEATFGVGDKVGYEMENGLVKVGTTKDDKFIRKTGGIGFVGKRRF